MKNDIFYRKRVNSSLINCNFIAFEKLFNDWLKIE